MASILERLEATFAARSEQREVSTVSIGLGYTAVEVDDGGAGLAYTMADRSRTCTHVRRFRDFEGGPASELLEYLASDSRLERSMAVALVNALNHARAAAMDDDSGPSTGIIERFGVGVGTRVSMVGFFPIVTQLEAIGAEVRVLDANRGLGDERTFLAELSTWSDAVILTATTLLNDTFSLFVDHVREDARVAVLGPTTPMVPEAFSDVPVDLLAGMVPVDADRVLAAVRQGGGTPAISPHCRKVAWSVPSGAVDA